MSSLLKINESAVSSLDDSRDFFAPGDFSTKYRDNAVPLYINQAAIGDTAYDYQQMNGTTGIGQAVKVQPVNLPTFVQPDRLDTKDYSILLSPDDETESSRSSFKAPFLVRVNRLLQVCLIALCGIAVLAYSLDVIMSHDVMLKQEQVRRLSEQNSELSARLLKSISFQGIQNSVLGRGPGPCNLRVAEEVLIAKEVPPAQFSPYKPGKYHLPLLSGY